MNRSTFVLIAVLSSAIVLLTAPEFVVGIAATVSVIVLGTVWFIRAMFRTRRGVSQ